MYRLNAEGFIMYIFLSILSICVLCVYIVKLFMEDKKHDLIIRIGKFVISIKKHD